MMSTKTHAAAATEFIADESRTDWHDETLWLVRKKRDAASDLVPEWELLREWASQIKAHTLSNLDVYLREFEQNARNNGVSVHWAADAEEHNRIVHQIILENKLRNVVKSKSMLTEECHLNGYLKDRGIEVLDTDLGELIVQLRKEAPSHIVMPAIHLKKQDVSDTFYQHLGTEEGNYDPQYLTNAARLYLRRKFVEADLAITGVNFAVAETGTVVVCTNEGNADMGVHAARVHIASMGIEKVIPHTKHLGVFLRLLARSATGQAITSYSSHYQRAAPGKQMHIIIVDNGRSRQLARADFRSSLKCIRCAACFNTCPVYRRSGGHSYHVTVAGPIGSILSPNIDMKAHADLPFASTLCGSCSNVCPVKIDIHTQLWKWRQVISAEGFADRGKKAAMQGLSRILSNPYLYRASGKLGRILLGRFPGLVNTRLNKWHWQREMPEVPEKSFREWFKEKYKQR